MINIVVPMAGAGSRFSKANYDKPKPFIDVMGKPMIIRVLDNLFHDDAKFILIAREEHLERERELVCKIKSEYNVEFITIDKLTEGTACTILYARKYINNDTPLLVANSDQIVDMDISKYVDDCLRRRLDGSILTFIDKYQDPKWSFARLNAQKMVVEVKEKEVISQYATVGLYFFSKGSSFVNSAIDMIIENDRVNNEFYTCPVYNYAIRSGLKIGVFNIDMKKMHGLGNPEDLKLYEKA